MSDEADAEERASAVDLGSQLDTLGFLLRLSQLKNFSRFYACFEAHDMRPGEYSILLTIRLNPGIRQGVLARALSIKRAHMTKMIRSLEARGIVSRTIPDDDRRSVELWLTKAGKDRVDAVEPATAALEDKEESDLGKGELENLKRLLRRYLELSEDGDTT